MIRFVFVLSLCSFLVPSVVCEEPDSLLFDLELPADRLEIFPKGFNLTISPSICCYENGSDFDIGSIRITHFDKWLRHTTFSGNLTKKVKNGNWYYSNNDRSLQEGDTLHYTVDLLFKPPYYTGTRSFRTLVVSKKMCTDCKLTYTYCYVGNTLVNGIKACGDQPIFHDDFSSLSDMWHHEVQFFNTKESEFTVYSNEFNTSGILDDYKYKGYFSTDERAQGLLYIKPKLLEEVTDVSVDSGTLELNGCTSPEIKNCLRKGQFWQVIPPIVSSRLTTKNSFSFKFGTVEIRAKFPRGDWVVPEIWLEPKNKVYGDQSGRIIIGKVRGNQKLQTSENDEIGARLLEQGFILNSRKNFKFEKQKIHHNPWSGDFHVYKLKWRPLGLEFSVDDEVVGTRLAETDIPLNPNIRGKEPIAPFDQEFYIHLGVHVGGGEDFPDDCKSNGTIKPWKDENIKKVLNFWNSRDDWRGTWSEGQPGEDMFLIDYIKVTSMDGYFRHKYGWV